MNTGPANSSMKRTYSGENHGLAFGSCGKPGSCGSHRCVSKHTFLRGAAPYTPGEQPQIAQLGSRYGASCTLELALPTIAMRVTPSGPNLSFGPVIVVSPCAEPASGARRHRDRRG